jgi:hypothetical protein
MLGTLAGERLRPRHHPYDETFAWRRGEAATATSGATIRALYREAGLPDVAYPAFREALSAMRAGLLSLASRRAIPSEGPP